MHALLVLVFLLNTSVSPSYDITPPTLVSFEITPQGLPFTDATRNELGNYCCITFTAHIQDFNSGLSSAEFWFYSQVAPTQTILIRYSGESPEIGTKHDGFHVFDIVVGPSQFAPGFWDLKSIRINDSAGNRTHFGSTQIQSLDIDTQFILDASVLHLPITIE